MVNYLLREHRLDQRLTRSCFWRRDRSAAHFLSLGLRGGLLVEAIVENVLVIIVGDDVRVDFVSGVAGSIAEEF